MFIIAFDISSSFLNLQVIGLGSATKNTILKSSQGADFPFPTLMFCERRIYGILERHSEFGKRMSQKSNAT
jgi:hypothetical protein